MVSMGPGGEVAASRVQGFYNRARRRSSLGYASLSDYEASTMEA